jgi:hypothetical protein
VRGIQPSAHAADRGGRGPSPGSAHGSGRAVDSDPACPAYQRRHPRQARSDVIGRLLGPPRARGRKHRGEIPLDLAGTSPPPAQKETEDEAHCHAVHGSSGSHGCGGGAPCHARARKPSARRHGRRDGAPGADGPTPVLAESLVHGGRTTVAASAPLLVVTRAIAATGPGGGATLHRTPSWTTRAQVSAPDATRTVLLREEVGSSVAPLAVSSSEKTPRQRSRGARLSV